jgi:hypothetical protein
MRSMNNLTLRGFPRRSLCCVTPSRRLRLWKLVLINRSQRRYECFGGLQRRRGGCRTRGVFLAISTAQSVVCAWSGLLYHDRPFVENLILGFKLMILNVVAPQPDQTNPSLEN